MEALVDAIQDVVTAKPETVVQSVPVQPDDGAIEIQLAQEISTLWTEHVRLSADRKVASKELRHIRAKLAERLYAMKAMLSRPGRAGQWRSWLRQQNIPRSTADRLALRYAETLGSDNQENVLTEAISNSPKDSAEKLARSMWQRFRKILATDESVVRFIGCFAEVSGVPHQWGAEGLMIFHAVPKAADESLASAPATGTAPQPPVEVPATTDGDAATPTGAVQAPAVADAGSGAVA